MIGKKTMVYEATQKCVFQVLNGVVLALDPSIGSSSSMPGIAVYRQGELVGSGTLDINPRESVPKRLAQLAHELKKVYNTVLPDVLVYEEIPSQRHGGSANSHASLLKAVGAALSVPGPDHYIGVLPVTWKRLVTPDYIKSDESDAIQIGRIVIELAREIQGDQEEKKKIRDSKKKQ